MSAPLRHALATFLALAATLRADPAEMEAKLARLPPGAALVTPATPLALSGKQGSAERVVVEGQPFTEAMRVRTTERPALPFKLQLSTPVAAPVKRGDALLAVFHARAIELPRGEYDARSEFVFEPVRAPFTRGNAVPLRIGPQWEKFYIPFIAGNDYPADGAMVRFRVGYEPQVTEFDVHTFDEQLQADYTRDFMTLVFSHPSTTGIITWGFWEGKHYIPNAALHRRDWSLRPAGVAWYDLIFRQWWTPAQQGVTDARGEFQMRGFHGDYVVEARGATQPAILRGERSRVGISVP